jgi:hypothetical protein
MKRVTLLGVAVAMAVGFLVSMPRTTARSDEQASPIYGVTIPSGYRDWKLIAVAQLLVPGKTDQLRAQFANDIAIKAFKEKTIPFPDGAIIAAVHWTRVESEENNKVLNGPFPGAHSFVVGSGVNVQFMVKDSKKYAATGGWGFADFKDGKPGSKEFARELFPLPRTGERSRLRLHPLRSLIPIGKELSADGTAKTYC